MARLIVSMNLSLDGYIEGADGDDGSWLSIDEEVHRAFNEMAAGAETFLYGRKVYEVMPPYWPAAAEDAARPAHEREYGRIWVDKPKVVFSSTLEEKRWSTRVVRSSAADEVRRLKESSSGTLLCYGGSALASSLSAEGLVDEYALFVHPVALGSGAPFFRGRQPLLLLGERRFATGVMGLRYATAGAGSS